MTVMSWWSWRPHCGGVLNSLFKFLDSDVHEALTTVTFVVSMMTLTTACPTLPRAYDVRDILDVCDVRGIPGDNDGMTHIQGAHDGLDDRSSWVLMKVLKKVISALFLMQEIHWEPKKGPKAAYFP